MTSVAQLLRQHKPRPTPSSRAPAPLPQRSNSIGMEWSHDQYRFNPLQTAGDLQRPSSTETITAQTNHLLASLGLDPHTATIAHALPAAASIIEVRAARCVHVWACEEHTHTRTVSRFPSLSPSPHSLIPPHPSSLQLLIHHTSHFHPGGLHELRLL